LAFAQRALAAALILALAAALIFRFLFGAGVADGFEPFCLAHRALCAAAILALAALLIVRLGLTVLAGFALPPPMSLASSFCSSST
jgi:hypothetical protein